MRATSAPRPHPSVSNPTEAPINQTQFFARIDEIAPGYRYDDATRLDAMPVYHRLAIERWLADVLERPVDFDVVRQFPTLGAAWAWLEEAAREGETIAGQRSVRPGSSTRVRLRPLLDDDLMPLYLASFDPATTSAWRYRGRTVPIGEFLDGLADGVRAQYVVEMIESGSAIGLVSAYDHHQAGLHCKVAFLRFGPREMGAGGATFEGMLVFLTHLFTTFPYRKVFAEVPTYNMGLFEPGFAQEEGVLRDYLFHDGVPVDLHIVSICREQWEQVHAATGW